MWRVITALKGHDVVSRIACCLVSQKGFLTLFELGSRPGAADPPHPNAPRGARVQLAADDLAELAQAKLAANHVSNRPGRIINVVSADSTPLSPRVGISVPDLEDPLPRCGLAS